MTFQRSKTARRNPRLTSAEPLEPRLALSAEGVAFGNSPYLTLSFAPDGTDVAGRGSTLFSYLNQVGPTEQWQQAILDGFQSWAIHTNADVAEVPDGGQPFGVAGRTLGDSRFGDVRVGAVPMRPGVYAVAVSRGVISGTWSGDLLFNSRVNLASIDEVFRVALHEAGHVFGLEHSAAPNSAMYNSGLPTVSQPSLDDLEAIWAQFGQRAADGNEPNDTTDGASQIHYSDGYSGQTPLIDHADLGVADVDVYRFDTFDNGIISGSVTFDARTQGLSQLQPRVRVFPRESNQPLPDCPAGGGTACDSNPSDEVFTAQLSDSERYYVVVDSVVTGLQAVGGYALVTTFDDHLVTSAATIDKYAGPEFRFLDQRQIEDIFAGDTEGIIPYFGDDFHTNDTLPLATPLTGSAGFIPGTRYEALASISDSVDVDFYQIRSADFGPGQPNVLSVLVESVADVKAPFETTVFDRNGQVLVHQNLIHHGGRTLIQLENVEPDGNHYLRIAGTGGETGNYRVFAISGTEAQSADISWPGSIPASSAPFERLFFAPLDRLTMFTFEGHATNSSTQRVRLSVTSQTGLSVLELVGTANSFLSADSIMLPLGTYRVKLEKLDQSEVPLDFQINQFVVTDPLAVPRVRLVDTAVVNVQSFDDVFVFRGGRGGNPDPGDGGGNPLPLPPSPSGLAGRVRQDYEAGTTRSLRKPMPRTLGEWVLANPLDEL